jgi:two-component system nitrogen regulation sensor histidine kinase NtrY
MLNAFAPKGAPTSSTLLSWPVAGRARAYFGIGYLTAAAVLALTIWLVAAAPGRGPIGPASNTLLLVLGLNLLLILSLTGAMGWRVVVLIRARDRDVGVRLHLRFVTLFAAAALIPAAVVALFFGVLVTQGIEGWFNGTARNAVENSRSIAKQYLLDVDAQMDRDLQLMTGELKQVKPLFDERIRFSSALGELAEFRGYAGLYVLNGRGDILARGETSEAPPYLAPPPPEKVFAGKPNDTFSSITDGPDAARALFPLHDYDDAYLYVVRPLSPGIVARLHSADDAIAAYTERSVNRAKVQGAFALAFGETALLVAVGAAWLGMGAAGAVTSPVARLVQAADRVASGDLSVRVETARDVEEIAVLSRAFNRMTSDLQTQQQALRAASHEAQSRRRFIERVLSGVSAGVIGLDEAGKVSAINRQALTLLALDETRTLGRALAEVAPELAGVVEQAERSVRDHEVDVTRDAETRRLSVRVSGGAEGGLVLTFDDITRLVTAQRSAAWRDVARRIAHEIKNPLTPIQLSAERLKRKYRGQVQADLDTFDRCTDTIIRQVGDIGRMVDEFSAFARMPAPKFAEEDAAELLRAAVFAQRVARADIELDMVEPEGPLWFVADGRMVARRVADPAASGGRIAARLKFDGERLAFVVEDDGIGLPAKDRDRLTEPYVTTREKGTGLGLAIVKRICEDHGGELVLSDAETLSGARVELRFSTALRAARSEKTSAAIG